MCTHCVQFSSSSPLFPIANRTPLLLLKSGVTWSHNGSWLAEISPRVRGSGLWLDTRVRFSDWFPGWRCNCMLVPVIVNCLLSPAFHSTSSNSRHIDGSTGQVQIGNHMSMTWPTSSHYLLIDFWNFGMVDLFFSYKLVPLWNFISTFSFVIKALLLKWQFMQFNDHDFQSLWMTTKNI